LNEIGIHNRLAIAANTEVRLFHEKVRSRAINTNERTQNVIDNCLKNSTDQMVARLPQLNILKETFNNNDNEMIYHKFHKIKILILFQHL